IFPHTVAHRYPCTLNQRVQGSSPCAPTSHNLIRRSEGCRLVEEFLIHLFNVQRLFYPAAYAMTDHQASHLPTVDQNNAFAQQVGGFARSMRRRMSLRTGPCWP